MALLPLIAGLPDTDPGSGGGSGGGSGDVTSAGDNTFTGTNIFPDGKLRVQITDPSLGLTAPTQFASYTQDNLVVNEMSNPQVGTEVLSFPREIWKTNGIAMDSALSTGFVGDLGILGELATLTIDSISVASPAVFTTAAAHGFTVGQIIWVQECTGYTPNVNGARVIGTTPSATQFTIDDLNVTETLSPFPGNVYARALGLRAADGSTLNLLTRDITGTWAADQWKANQITLTESGTTLAGVNAAVRPAQSFWSYAMFGLNLRATASGYESVTEGATPGSGFGLMIERDYFVDAPAVATDKYFTHEFYFQDRNNARPFFGGQSEAVEATVTQTGTATVTISASQTESWARLGDGTVAAGMRFRFTQLTGASGVNTTTWYYVLTSPSATTFTYSDSPGGAAIVATFSATSTATRGGWGNFALNVPTAINVGTGFGTASNYNTSTVPVPIFSAISNVAGRDGYIKFDNLSALDSSFFIDFSTANTARRRMGINTLGSNNPRDFCIQDATTGAMDFQLQAGGSIALGYAAYHAAASTLDVNGTVTATAFSGVGVPTYLRNAADVESVNTTPTTIFTIPVLANKAYDIEVQLFISALDTILAPAPRGGYQVSLTYPASIADFDGHVHELIYSPTIGSIQQITTAVPWVDVFGASETVFAQGDGTNDSVLGTITVKIGFVTGGSDGTFIFKGNQTVTDASYPTKFRKTSWARYTKLN